MSDQTIPTTSTKTPPNRREFIRRAGLASAVAAVAPAAAAIFAGKQDAQAIPATNIDVAVLNFALNLEYLEAEFYLRAYTGTGIVGNGGSTDSTQTGGPGSQTVVIKANPQVPFTMPVVKQYAFEIAKEEFNHVLFLRAGIAAAGASYIPAPKIDLENSFNAAYAAATGSPNATFDPFANDIAFLLGAFIFEDVGVTAYNGAATLITDPNYLQAAASILAVEAYHASQIRTTLFALASQPGAIQQYGVDIFATVNAISNLRGYLSGDPTTDQPIKLNNTANIVPTDNNALARTRSTRQVLNVVYGNQGDTNGAVPGGFLPNGANGAIR